MRRSPRTILLLLPIVLLAPVAASCGGSEVSADEVPGDAPALIVPSDTELGGGGSNADGGSSADSADADADADSTTDPDTGGATVPAEPTDPSGGTAAPEPTVAPEDTTTDPAQTDAPPETGDDFCEQNVGAC
jgi:outer membrane biosynthesis protein TonB